MNSPAATITLEADATDLSRNLAHSTMSIEVPRGAATLDLAYITWTPGNHTPSGPVENVTDLRITDCRGDLLRWDRDPARMERLTVQGIPAECDHIRVALTYIAGQPNFNSRSTDTYGKPRLAVLNWNTVLLYPAAQSHQQITVDASLALPREWSFACALLGRQADDERFAALRASNPGAPTHWVAFDTVTLARLVDSPVIMGRHITPYPLSLGADTPPHFINVVAAEEAQTKIPDWLLHKYEAMCRQTFALFDFPGKPAFPRERYEFLLVLDESMRFAVEHAECTLTSLAPTVFSAAEEKPGKGGGSATTVLAHEYFHAWCGKLACPEGLVRPDFHTPARTELLWAYEGLTSYYDNVLSARAGMLTLEEFKQDLLTSAVTLEQRSGRLWRSVEDTARAARHLRNRGLYWYDRRRGQEYYTEGAMFWMEADAVIRAASNGAKSLDDFCRTFFDVPVNPVGAQATYTRADIVRALGELDPATDWDALIRARIEEPALALGMNPLMQKLGWRIEYGAEPTAEQKKIGAFEETGGELSLRTSLGLRLSKDAEIIDLVPGSPADEAGLAYGMKVIAVDGWVYTPARLKAALKDSPTTKQVELTVSFGDRLEVRTIKYGLGPRIPFLTRVENTRDILSEVAAPR